MIYNNNNNKEIISDNLSLNNAEPFEKFISVKTV